MPNSPKQTQPETFWQKLEGVSRKWFLVAGVLTIPFSAGAAWITVQLTNTMQDEKQARLEQQLEANETAMSEMKTAFDNWKSEMREWKGGVDAVLTELLRGRD